MLLWLRGFGCVTLLVISTSTTSSLVWLLVSSFSVVCVYFGFDVDCMMVFVIGGLFGV